MAGIRKSTPRLSAQGALAVLAKLEPHDPLTIWQLRYFEKRGCLEPVKVKGFRLYSAVDVAILRTAIKLGQHFWAALGVWACLLYLSSELRAVYAAGDRSKWLVITDAAKDGRRFRPGPVRIVGAKDAASVPPSRKIAVVSVLDGIDVAMQRVEKQQAAWRPMTALRAVARESVA
jgi:hypothetical protein